jgi:hypothetical protein
MSLLSPFLGARTDSERFSDFHENALHVEVPFSLTAKCVPHTVADYTLRATDGMKRLSDYQSEVPMKTTVALFFALVILLPHSANATTLTITFGSAVLNQEVGPRGQGAVIRFAGDDFSVLQFQESGSFDSSRAFGVEALRAVDTI